MWSSSFAGWGLGHESLPSSVLTVVTALLVGAVTGYALPRPAENARGAASGLVSKLALFGSYSSAWRRAALAWHGASIIRVSECLGTCVGVLFVVGGSWERVYVV